jgi:hypothetical protein
MQGQSICPGAKAWRCSGRRTSLTFDAIRRSDSGPGLINEDRFSRVRCWIAAGHGLHYVSHAAFWNETIPVNPPAERKNRAASKLQQNLATSDRANALARGDMEEAAPTVRADLSIARQLGWLVSDSKDGRSPRVGKMT